MLEEMYFYSPSQAQDAMNILLLAQVEIASSIYVATGVKNYESL